MNRKPPPKKAKGFVYKERTAEDIKKRAERTDGRFDSIFKSGTDTYRPKNGDNVVRILPPTWDSHEHYAYSAFVHRNIGADNSTYLCLNKMLGKKCPICAAAKEAKDSGEEDEAKALRWVELCIAWIIDRDEDDNPQLWSMSWTMDRDIAALCHNKRTGKILLIDHPDEGYDVSFKRTGQGLRTKYYGHAVDRDPSPIVDDEGRQQEILDYITENPVPDMLKYYDYEHLQNVLNGTAEADADADPDADDPDADPDAGEDGQYADDADAGDDQYVDDPDADPDATTGEDDQYTDDPEAATGEDDQYPDDADAGEEAGDDAGDDNYVDEPEEPPPPTRRPERVREAPARQAPRPVPKQASRPAPKPAVAPAKRPPPPASRPQPKPQPRPAVRPQPKPQPKPVRRPTR